MLAPLLCSRCRKPLVEGCGGVCAKCELEFSYSERGLQTLNESSGKQLATPEDLRPDTAIDSVSADGIAFETITRHVPAESGTESFLSDHASSNHLPSVPSGYELRRLLGGGGMGEVYLAWESTTERSLAMKFLRGGGRTALQRFQVEVRALAVLNHPNIVRVIATDFLRAEPYFTMEYASGGTLSELVSQRGQLEAIEAARLLSVVARAVEAAHRQGVLHRDLKPSNILLDAEGAPKVSDFGLAKRMDRDDNLTVHVGAMGTPGYMPPEQIEDHESIGVTSDVYGLGATLFHVLTGRPPFTGESRQIILERVRTHMPPRPRSLNPKIPAALEGILLKSLEKDPKCRYQSAAEFADDLDRFVANQRPLAPRLTLRHRLKFALRRQRKRIAIVAIAACLAVGLVLIGKLIGTTSIPAIDPEPLVLTAEEEIQNELAEGKTVSLLKSDGMPRYYRAMLARSTPESNAKDRSFTFHSQEHGILEIIPNPKIDRYRVRLMIQHVDSRLVRGVDPNERDFVAFYFGHEQASSTDGCTVHLLAGPSYSDCDPQAITEKRAIAAQPVFFREFVLTEQPNTNVSSSRTKSAVKNFIPPGAVPPGRWRPLIVDVTPDEVRVQWQAEDGSMVDLMRWSGDKMRKQHADLRQATEKAHPGVAEKLPDWTPQLPFGLYSFKTVVAVKDLTIEPLPSTDK